MQTDERMFRKVPVVGLAFRMRFLFESMLWIPDMDLFRFLG